MSLIDLAGSERAAGVNKDKERLKVSSSTDASSDLSESSRLFSKNQSSKTNIQKTCGASCPQSIIMCSPISGGYKYKQEFIGFGQLHQRFGGEQESSHTIQVCPAQSMLEANVM